MATALTILLWMAVAVGALWLVGIIALILFTIFFD